MRRGGWPGPALAPQRMQLLPCVLGKRHPLYLPPTASLGRFSFVSPSLGKRGDSSGAIASARAGRLRGREEGAPGLGLRHRCLVQSWGRGRCACLVISGLECSRGKCTLFWGWGRVKWGQGSRAAGSWRAASFPFPGSWKGGGGEENCVVLGLGSWGAPLEPLDSSASPAGD